MKRSKLCPIVVLVCLVVQLALVANVEAAPPTLHMVRWGETLYSIARRYGTTAEAIMRANGLRNPNRIYVGQRLIVSTAVSPAISTTYRVQPGDNLYSIAYRHGITVEAIVRANRIYNPHHIYVGQRLTIPGGTSPAPSVAPSANVHVVRAGENLARIALRYNTSVWAITVANNLSNPSFIYPGQRLVISGTSSRPSAIPQTNAPSGKWIDIDLSAQALVAYEGQRIVLRTAVSTGRSWTPTPTGRYRIYRKARSQTMSGPGYHVPNVPHVMAFHGNYTMHGCYWHYNFGQPMSHGCVNLPLAEAEWLYNWAPVGTLVVVHR